MTNRPPTKPEDLFRAEKERALTVRNSQHARLLAEAKAAFDKLMAEGQAARKSGRPRKHPLPPLKTSSSRTPFTVKPAAPPSVAKPVAQAPTKPTPAAKPGTAAKVPTPESPQPPQLLPPPKPPKLLARAATKGAKLGKHAPSAKREGKARKPRARSTPKRAARKPKPKAKRSTRR